MTNPLRTFSVVINWDDQDPEQGTYGATVRAKDPDEAEHLVRLLMTEFDMSNYDRDEADVFELWGSVVECSPGAIWRAEEMEAALRAIVALGPCEEVLRIANHELTMIENSHVIPPSN